MKRHFSQKQRTAIAFARELAKVSDINIVFYQTEGGKGANGWYDRESDTIYIDLFSGFKNEQAMLRTLSHELTHFIEKYSPEHYEGFKNFLLDYYYGKDEGATLERLIEKEKRLAPNQTREYWENEVVANASEMFVKDEGAMRALIGEHADIAKSVDQWFSKMNYALRRAYKGVSASGEAAAELAANVEVFSEAQQRWNALLKESVEAKKAAQGAGENSGAQFSQRGNIYDYTKSFEEQIEDYKKGLIPENDTLLVGATPDVWQKIGFNALPVTINQTHVGYALNGTKDADHSIGEALLKDLPNQIKNPVAIIQSQSPGHSGRAVVIMEMTHNGKQVVSAVEIDGQGRTNNIRIDSNAMATLFAKSNVLKQLNAAINNTVNGGTELFYWNKKETSALLQRAGLQLPSSLPRDGFVHSITDQGSKVNPKFSNVTETQQFKRWFGDWQKNPKKASKVVNKDGTPMVVYHGTTVKGIEAFDISKAKDGALGKGFYFSDSKEYATGFTYSKGEKTGEVIKAYLSIRNPYIAKYPGGINTENLKAKGYDGVYNPSTGFWVAFEPTQIKATNNIGTFDKDNPDIRFSRRAEKFSQLDSEYAKAVESNDTETAEKLVEEAARAAGYNSPLLYHGTQSFGFTKLDVSKSDDGISFFSTTNPDMAQTYSGEYGKRAIGRFSGKDINALSPEQVAARLNDHEASSKYPRKYYLMDRADVTKLESKVKTETDALIAYEQKLLEETANRIAKAKRRGDSSLWLQGYKDQAQDINDLIDDLETGNNAAIYMAANRSEASDEALAKRLFELEADMRLKSEIDRLGEVDRFFVGETANRYTIAAFKEDAARKILKGYDEVGNYSLYGKTDDFFEIDGGGTWWSNISATLEPKGGNTFRAEYDSASSTLKLSDKNGQFAKIPTSTLSEAEPAMAREITKRYGKYFAAKVLAQARDQLRNNASAEVDVKTIGTVSTREIAQFAKEQGYRGVKITDIYDNGGIGNGADTGDVYIFFNPETDVKSADAVTYDNEGKVIPLSGRFNEKNEDIRFSKRNKFDSEGRELSEAQQEFFKDSKVRDEEGRLLTVYHGSDTEFFVFDRTKARANMDIQGSFFSPWEIDAQGYGGKVGEYYLNIANPASEAMGYKALKKFQGQNGAGIKAREYLQSLGYDGVNNGGEEYIAFESNQIKNVTNKAPTESPDIRYSMRGENWKPALDKTEWEVVNSAVENQTGNELTETADYFFRKEKGKTVFGIYSTDDSTLLYAVHGEQAYQEYSLVKAFKEEIKNAAYSSTEGLGTWDEAVWLQYGANTADRTSTLASGRHSGNAALHGKQQWGNTNRALRNVIQNIFSARQTDGRRESGESEGNRGLTVSDLGKVQYQLRTDDKNRLDILDKQEERLANDLKTLEKAYGKAIREEYERNIKPNEEMSKKAAEINKKAAQRFMNEVGAMSHMAKAEREHIPKIIPQSLKHPVLILSTGYFFRFAVMRFSC